MISINLSISVRSYLSIYLSISVSSYLSIYIYIYISQSIHIYLSIYLNLLISIYLSLIFINISVFPYLSKSICCSSNIKYTSYKCIYTSPGFAGLSGIRAGWGIKINGRFEAERPQLWLGHLRVDELHLLYSHMQIHAEYILTQ